MLKRTLPLLFAALAISASADESTASALTDKSSSAKVMAKYEKVFAAARKAPPAPGSIICIGSSHMEFWKTVADDLAPLLHFSDDKQHDERADHREQKARGMERLTLLWLGK